MRSFGARLNHLQDLEIAKKLSDRQGQAKVIIPVPLLLKQTPLPWLATGGLLFSSQNYSIHAVRARTQPSQQHRFSLHHCNTGRHFWPDAAHALIVTRTATAATARRTVTLATRSSRSRTTPTQSSAARTTSVRHRATTQPHLAGHCAALPRCASLLFCVFSCVMCA